MTVTRVGCIEGKENEGAFDGDVVGSSLVGESEGTLEGADEVGFCDGSVNEGAVEGLEDGITDGWKVGRVVVGE